MYVHFFRLFRWEKSICLHCAQCEWERFSTFRAQFRFFLSHSHFSLMAAGRFSLNFSCSRVFAISTYLSSSPTDFMHNRHWKLSSLGSFFRIYKTNAFAWKFHNDRNILLDFPSVFLFILPIFFVVRANHEILSSSYSQISSQLGKTFPTHCPVGSESKARSCQGFSLHLLCTILKTS